MKYYHFLILEGIYVLNSEVKIMVQLKEILNYREIEMMQHFQSIILNADIEDLETVKKYQDEIQQIINDAKKRYYEENPAIVPMRSDSNKENHSVEKMTVKTLLTKEEEAEVNFLRWRITKSITPWGIRKKKKRIDTILEEALKRNGYDPRVLG